MTPLHKMFALGTSAMVLATGITFAGEVDKQTPKERTQQTERNRQGMIPEFLSELDLSEDQTERIRGIMKTHDKKAEKLWDEFHSLHWRTVEMQSHFVAANRLEGHDHSAHGLESRKTENLNSETQKQIRENERILEQARASLKKAEAADSPDREKIQAARKAIREAEAAQREAIKEAKAAEAANAEDATETETETETAALPEKKQKKRTKQNKEVNQQTDKPSEELNILSMRIAVLQPDGRIKEIRLTQPESEGQAKLKSDCPSCDAMQKEMAQLGDRIHDVHMQLVNIEADRMVAIEAELTQSQIEKLMESGKAKWEKKALEADASNPTPVEVNKERSKTAND